MLFFLFSHLHLFIYIYTFNFINDIFIQNSKIKLGAKWKNLCRLNDFKEDNKIVF